MEIETRYPRHPVLKKYIAYYYFMKTSSPAFNTTYYAFPNTLLALNIHKQVSCEIGDHYIKVYESQENEYLCLFQSLREKPLLVNLCGCLDKVTIILQPLGLNPFIRRSFADLARGPSVVFTEWTGQECYQQLLDQFYSTNDLDKRIDLLEKFFLSVYTENEESESMQQAVALLLDFERELPIEEIAKQLSMHPRTFHRQFVKHMGKSPVVFRRIARFRHSLKNRLFNDQFRKLTEIGYASNFYDQSYFIKIYNQCAGSNPTAFFNCVEKLADNQLILKFIEKL